VGRISSLSVAVEEIHEKLTNLDCENKHIYHTNTANGTAGQVEGMSRESPQFRAKGRSRITEKWGIRDVKDKVWDEFERISNYSYMTIRWRRAFL
jgi:hypothetical protein